MGVCSSSALKSTEDVLLDELKKLIEISMIELKHDLLNCIKSEISKSQTTPVSSESNE
jgi:hypothetical protein